MQIPIRTTSAKRRPKTERPLAHTVQPGARELRVAMRLRLSLRLAAVEGFEESLSRLCSEMMNTGISREKLYQARMLAVSLIHAKRLVDLAIKSAECCCARQDLN